MPMVYFNINSLSEFYKILVWYQYCCLLNKLIYKAEWIHMNKYIKRY